MDVHRFDELARRTTAGRSTRRLVATGIFAAAAASIPGIGGLDAVARRKKRKKKRRPLRCSGDSCDGAGGKRCGGRDDCQCYRAAKGGNVCASSLQSSLETNCGEHKDCPRGHVCVEGGPACGGDGLKFCKKACYK